ncbi:hypothetical protein RP20_CCG018373 [Aedes albopictus]|nr:hypothetical protein RP20_CCG018373 [Aedes albopictus]
MRISGSYSTQYQESSISLRLQHILYPLMLLSAYVDYVGQVVATAAASPDGPQQIGISFAPRSEQDRKDGLTMQHFAYPVAQFSTIIYPWIEGLNPNFEEICKK